MVYPGNYMVSELKLLQQQRENNLNSDKDLKQQRMVNELKINIVENQNGHKHQLRLLSVTVVWEVISEKIGGPISRIKKLIALGAHH